MQLQLSNVVKDGLVLNVDVLECRFFYKELVLLVSRFMLLISLAYLSRFSDWIKDV